MVTYVRDLTGRFLQRPHYKPEELDRECESVISGFLKDLYGEVRYPVCVFQRIVDGHFR